MLLRLASSRVGIACALLLLCGAVLARGAVRPEPGPEVEHLLRFVYESDCVFERNGARHTSREAGEHLSKKYNYYSREIHTAEDFIDKAASRSELTGREYRVSCGGEPWVTSREWLMRELHRYRAGGSRTSTQPSELREK